MPAWKRCLPLFKPDLGVRSAAALQYTQYYIKMLSDALGAAILYDP